jgi:hypothetical protein
VIESPSTALNHTVNSTTLIIDPEFKALIPPLLPEERAGLEASILDEGCRDALVVWKGQGVLIDGHNRHDICTKHGIAFEITELEFDTRDDVIIWIIRNQLGRRNLAPFARSELALEMEGAIARKAKENQLSGLKQFSPVSSTLTERKPVTSVDIPVCQNSDKRTIDTKKEVAKIANVSHDTIWKTKKIIEKAPEPVLEKLRRGEATINKVYNGIKREEDLKARREELAAKAEAVTELPDTIQVYHGDFLKEYVNLGAGSVDCIITDPPYVAEWLENYEAFAHAAEYVLKPGGFLITYVGHIHLDKILDQMCRHLDFYWIAALKHAGTTAAVHSRSVTCGFKPILIFQKPPRTSPKRYFCDMILGTGREKSAHEWQQGKEELRQIFEPFTDPGDTVLDPFMGSGTVLDMAREMGRKTIGFDIDELNVQIVRGRVAR